MDAGNVGRRRNLHETGDVLRLVELAMLFVGFVAAVAFAWRKKNGRFPGTVVSSA